MSAPPTQQRSPPRSPRAELIDDALLSQWEKTQTTLASQADYTDAKLGFDPSSLLNSVTPSSSSSSKKKSAAVGSMTAQAPVVNPIAAATAAIATTSLTAATAAAASASTPPCSWADVATSTPALRFIGGIDISFLNHTHFAVASLIVLDALSGTEKNPLPVVYEDMLHVEMKVPYVPSYLAFREVDPARQLLGRIRDRMPHVFPQIVFIDGNGALHHRRCGLATHLGVLENLPVVGCAKNLLAVDGLSREGIAAQVARVTTGASSAASSSGNNNDDDAAAAAAQTNSGGDDGTFSYHGVTLMPLIGTSKFNYGFAALTGNSSKNPIFISPGHRISQKTAAMLAVRLSPFRVCEPIRQADLRSRKYIADNFPTPPPPAAKKNDSKSTTPTNATTNP